MWKGVYESVVPLRRDSRVEQIKRSMKSIMLDTPNYISTISAKPLMPTDELKLPVELWLLVFSFGKFSSNDLAVLCRVCAGLYHAVVDSLYESITVDNSDVCTTLAECPHLAEKVKSFVFTYQTIMVYDGPEVHLDNLTSALKNMTCLPTLKLIHSQKHEYSSVLQYCDAELHVFHCTYRVNRRLLSFLNRQDSLSVILLSLACPHSISIPNAICFFPRLCHF
jgi:hypothetical protein